MILVAENIPAGISAEFMPVINIKVEVDQNMLGYSTPHVQTVLASNKKTEWEDTRRNGQYFWLLAVLNNTY